MVFPGLKLADRQADSQICSTTSLCVHSIHFLFCKERIKMENYRFWMIAWDIF